jgi:hypothetical protein
MHPLDNVIWNALTTRQADFAECFDQSRRFMPEVTSLGGFREPTMEGYESLVGLLPAHGTIALFLEVPYQPRAGWKLVASVPLLQMVCGNGSAASGSKISSGPDVVELGAADSPEMIELTSLTKPRAIRKTHA